ncbi:GNAT family N-acetyltransferase [Micromonospora coerulea]|uniref:GNAT family N-acetyltransferase n=1 Tax=Micromonospora coerulea TaxID=47856 RepID=UPI001903B674|nr:GNAT family N-acetyltransferase [Micromonospora veneta]
MAVIIRAFRSADARAAAAALRAGAPYQVVTPELLGWQATSAPAAERHAALVAESAGELVGVARTGLLHESAEPGLGFANVTVHPHRRGRGAGAALLAAAEERLAGLGVLTAYAKVADDPAAIALAERRGYRRGRLARLLHLDLAATELPQVPAPSGVRLTSAAELADPKALYAADLDVSRDEPGEVGMDEISYDDWRAAYWDRPDLDRSLTSVALVDDVVVAFSFALTDGRDRYQSGMTGTRRAYRGMGLARPVKLAGLRRAWHAGYRHAVTSNDAESEAMLAVNRRLGYRVVGREWRYRRELRR